MSAPHLPVLLDEALAALAPRPGDVIVDATFGAGGYTHRLLAAGATVHAFDRDPDAIAAGSAWPETNAEPPRLVLHPRRFSEMVAALTEAGVAAVDGVVMDVGVSSMQLDQAERGFAFSAEGPLDMRMSREGPSAADFVNGAREEDRSITFGEVRLGLDASVALRWKLLADLAHAIEHDGSIRRGSLPEEPREQAMDDLLALADLLLQASRRALENGSTPSTPGSFAAGSHM